MPRSIHAALLLVLVLLIAGCGGTGSSASFKEGRTIYGDICSACHGSRGQGGVGPSLDSVIETWPTCDAHVEWVEVGSEGWSQRYGDTYGATDKPVQGGMPAHGNVLTLEEMRLVAAFERISYGGQSEADAFEDCRVG